MLKLSDKAQEIQSIVEDLEKKINIAIEGFNKILTIENLCFAECSDAEFIMDTARDSLLKIQWEINHDQQ